VKGCLFESELFITHPPSELEPAPHRLALALVNFLLQVMPATILFGE